MHGFVRIALVLSLSLSGCSMLGGLAAKAALGGVTGGSDGLSVDANVGQAKSEGDQGVTQNAATAVTAQLNESTTETFEGPVGTVVNESGLEMHELLLLVLLAGWAIPAPREMLLGTVRTFRDAVLVFRRVPPVVQSAYPDTNDTSVDPQGHSYRANATDT